MVLQNVKGTRDFLPKEMIKRQKVIEKIKKVFERYGFSPATTPAFEYAELLEGNLGEEEKLIYRFEDMGGRKLSLRYDLTVPLARMFANNPLPLPFKRYDISRVWRHDNPQKGRYREFWQCDIDTIGASSMKADAEIIMCGITALQTIGIKEFKLRLNNRKILEAIVKAAGINEDKAIAAFRTIDKIGKIGTNEIFEEFKANGIEKLHGEKLLNMLFQGDPDDVLPKIETIIGENEGITELKEIIKWIKITKYGENIIIDLSLARGLDYYTGPIFEVNVEEYSSSIAGGGRYDNLIERISGRSVPAVGMSLGIERIMEILEEKNVLGERKTVTDVYVLCADNESYVKAWEIAHELRNNDINTEIDLIDRNFTNKLDYVNKQGIEKLIIVGQKDLKNGNVTLKYMQSKEKKEEKIPVNEIISRLVKS